MKIHRLKKKRDFCWPTRGEISEPPGQLRQRPCRQRAYVAFSHTLPGVENREFSRDHKSSEQFVWLNRRHREMETQLAHSSVAFDDTNSASGGVDLGSFSGYGLPWVV